MGPANINGYLLGVRTTLRTEIQKLARSRRAQVEANEAAYWAAYEAVLQQQSHAALQWPTQPAAVRRNAVNRVVAKARSMFDMSLGRVVQTTQRLSTVESASATGTRDSKLGLSPLGRTAQVLRAARWRFAIQPASPALRCAHVQTAHAHEKGLLQLDAWLVAAQKVAEDKKFEPANFLTERLVVDQLPFARQVQVACDTLKLGASRLTGKDAPKHADDERSVDDLRARVASTTGYLDTFSASDFETSATRSITQPRWEGKSMSGADYFLEHVTPNFYFHMTTAYSILRCNGVPLGKKDYLGALSMRAPA